MEMAKRNQHEQCHYSEVTVSSISSMKRIEDWLVDYQERYNYSNGDSNNSKKNNQNINNKSNISQMMANSLSKDVNNDINRQSTTPTTP